MNTSILETIFEPVYNRYFGGDKRQDFVETFDRTLSQALIDDTPELYLTRSIGYSLITGLLVWMISVVTLYFTGVLSELTLGIPVPNETLLQIIDIIKIPFLLLVSGTVISSFVGLGVFFALVKYPSSIASGRKREINILLPDAVSYMYALSIGGLSQIEIFRAVAEAEDTYGEISVEFKTILKQTEYFQTDYRSAIQDHIEITPSKEFELFLTDLLSIISSGGDLETFLKDQQRKFIRSSRQQQEETLDTLELFGEMYMTLSLFPLLLIIVMMTMGIMGEADMFIIYMVVYALIPLIGVGFLVMLSTVKQDDYGDGILEEDVDPNMRDRSVMKDKPLAADKKAREYEEDLDYEVFSDIKQTETVIMLKNLFFTPHKFFRENPIHTLMFTVPLTLIIVGSIFAVGSAPTTPEGVMDNVVWASLVYFYIPSYIICTPLAIFYELKYRDKYAITNRLSETLRKMANANDTGQTVLESMRTISKSSKGKLATEFGQMYQKVQYGQTIKQVMIDFNNRYRIPRLARTTRLVMKSQETTEQIGDVLVSAAKVSENTDEIERERKSRSRMQVAIILMTYLALLGVMVILQTQFVDVMADLAGDAASGGDDTDFDIDLDVDELSMLFFHAVTLQAVFSGIISGYITSTSILAGMKFVLVLQTISLIAWIIIG